MAPRFNSPPGWPPPPPGWLPPAGWQPDPSWPPAPPGWEFIIDDAVAGYGYPLLAVSPTPQPPARATSTIVLLVVSIVATLSFVLTLAGIPTLVLAIIAMANGRSHPGRARTLTRAGWITFGAVTVLITAATIIDFATNP